MIHGVHTDSVDIGPALLDEPAGRLTPERLAPLDRVLVLIGSQHHFRSSVGGYFRAELRQLVSMLRYRADGDGRNSIVDGPTGRVDHVGDGGHQHRGQVFAPHSPAPVAPG